MKNKKTKTWRAGRPPDDPLSRDLAEATRFLIDFYLCKLREGNSGGASHLTNAQNDLPSKNGAKVDVPRHPPHIE